MPIAMKHVKMNRKSIQFANLNYHPVHRTRCSLQIQRNINLCVNRESALPDHRHITTSNKGDRLPPYDAPRAYIATNNTFGRDGASQPLSIDSVVTKRYPINHVYCTHMGEAEIGPSTKTTCRSYPHSQMFPINVGPNKSAMIVATLYRDVL